MTSFEPDYYGARVRPSPNFGERRNCSRPDAIVLHYTGMEDDQAAEAWLCDPRSEVSAHYVVHIDGQVIQLVPEAARAWHAGRGSWKGETDMNSHSIGIEIANPGHSFGYPDFPPKQIGAVVALCRDICARQNIMAERVIAHSDLAPGRKIDPGEKFPWAELATSGVGLFIQSCPISDGPVMAPGETGQSVRALQSALAEYGYPIEITNIYDTTTKIVVEAFQRHFRPAKVDGLADVSTLGTLNRLIEIVRRHTP